MVLRGFEEVLDLGAGASRAVSIAIARRELRWAFILPSEMSSCADERISLLQHLPEWKGVGEADWNVYCLCWSVDQGYQVAGYNCVVGSYVEKRIVVHRVG